jgi:hypothetical protein
MDSHKVVAELRQEREQIDMAIMKPPASRRQLWPAPTGPSVGVDYGDEGR